MKKIPLLILALAVFLTADCATAKPAKNVAAGSVMYTNAPREVAFNASCEALEKLGYKIETKDVDKFFVKGSYANPWAGHTPLYAQIEVSQDASATKIIYGVDQPGAIRLLDVTGRYSRCANNIRREIEKILAQEDIAYRKNKAKQARELAREDSD